jgi:hypothetical protein
MPEEIARINFYEVNDCGYYDEADNYRFGDIANLLPDLMRWVLRDGLSVRQTLTFDVGDDAKELPVYCAGMRTANGDYLLTTWNETPMVDGQTASIQGDTDVIAPQVLLTNVPDGGIPGFATYFWFLPQQGVFATIRFSHQVLNGHKGMCLYLRSFLQKFSPHADREPVGDGLDIAVRGYRNTPGSPTEQLRVKFSTRALRRRALIDRIRATRPHIRWVVRKNRLRVQSADDQAFFQRALTAMGLREQPARLEHELRYQQKVEWTPSPEQLELMIRDWEANHGLQWDDIGFQIAGEATPLWLSHSIAKTSHVLDIQRHNAELVQGESLLAALSQNKAVILDSARLAAAAPAPPAPAPAPVVQ